MGCPTALGYLAFLEVYQLQITDSAMLLLQPIIHVCVRASQGGLEWVIFVAYFLIPLIVLVRCVFSLGDPIPWFV